MTDTFADLYAQHSKEVFLERARQQLAHGDDALTCARNYAEQGKPDFTLAFLLLTEAAEETKHALLAHAYEQRAKFSDAKAESFDQQFHRPFPMIKLEAQKDRSIAQQVRQGRRIRREIKTHINLN